MQIIFEAKNQQILYKEEAGIFYSKDLESKDILCIHSVLQECLSMKVKCN